MTHFLSEKRWRYIDFSYLPIKGKACNPKKPESLSSMEHSRNSDSFYSISNGRPSSIIVPINKRFALPEWFLKAPTWILILL